MKMQHLPNELWALIIDQLEFPTTYLSSSYLWRHPPQLKECHLALYNLCRTSRRFLRLAQPVLYRTLPAPRETMVGTVPAPGQNIRGALLSTLEQYPQLARHVKAVGLSNAYLSRNELATHILPYYASTRAGPRSEVVQQRIHDLPKDPEGDVNVADLSFAHWVALLPNLKRLELETRGADPLFCSLLRRAVQPEPKAPATTFLTALAYTPLEKVEYFHIEAGPYGAEPIRLHAYQDIFWLPRLRTFRSENAVLDTTLTYKAPTPGRPHRLSTVRHAYFKFCFATADRLADLLRACPSLQTLHVLITSLTMGECRMDFGRLGEVLRAHGAALVDLELDFQEALEDEPDEATGQIGSLRCLSRLRHLRVEIVALLEPADGGGANGDVGARDDRLESLLPESLESLDIEPADYSLRSLTADVLGVLTSRRLARLKHVSVRENASYFLTSDVEGWRRQGDIASVNFYR